jgi:membrane protease YdiL (CAAX protease family)
MSELPPPALPELADDTAARQPGTAEPGPRVRVWEVLVVLGATVGLSLASIARSGQRDAVKTGAFTDAHLVSLLAYEALATLLLVPWLWRRGWRPHAIAGAPPPMDVLRGGGVWLLAMAAYALAWIIFQVMQPAAAHAIATAQPFTGVPASAATIVVLSIVNPVFEEFLWLGYFVARLEAPLGMRTAAVLSVVCRTLVHAYQGPLAIIGILPVGVALTWYYGRTRRIWPVIVVHVLFDAIGLVQRLSSQ